MVSPYTTSLAADYSFPVTVDFQGYLRVDHSWRSKRYVEVTNTDYIADYHTVNLRVGIRNDSFKVEAFATNLFDDDTPSGAVRYFDGRLPGMSFNTTFQRRRPSQIGISLSYDF
jgi:iron complex outermembrane receptor protein